jgi:16S rRNA (guanine527-N7)-methyltransferase
MSSASKGPSKPALKKQVNRLVRSSPDTAVGVRDSGARRAPRQAPPPAWSEAAWLLALPPVLDALKLPLDSAQQQKLAAYMVLLTHWNSTFNLTAVRDPQDMLTHHLADCLAVLAPLDRRLSKQAEGPMSKSGEHIDAKPVRILDVGSGGGLPGVVLAIARPDVEVTCVDTVGKKAAFIRQAAAELRLPKLKAEHARVEQLKTRYELITSRAFASITDFVALTAHLMADGGVWMAMKGKHPHEEIAALPSDIKVFHVEQLSVPGLEADRCLVWMKKEAGASQG